MENKIEMKWEIKEWGKDYYGSGQYENKYYIELEIWDIANEDAAKVCQSYSDDWDIANELYLDVEDYIFYLAKWGKVQKEVGRDVSIGKLGKTLNLP